MASLKVLIVGAGVGGPATAYWLSKIPQCTVTVVEISASLRNTGQQIDLRGQGIVMMKMMGIQERVRAVLCHEPGTRLINSNGQSQAYLAANTSGAGITDCHERVRNHEGGFDKHSVRGDYQEGQRHLYFRLFDTKPHAG